MKDASYQPEPSFLFFGCRNQSGDFYYASEWSTFKQDRILDEENGLITAFSRDQKEKVYVTHKIAEHGALICDLLMHKEASVYVAGSANKMPTDVQQAILNALATHAGTSIADSQMFLRQLEINSKYQVESWS